MKEKHVFKIEAMGTVLVIKIYDDLNLEIFKKLEEKIENFTTWFDNTFSRFKPNSLVTAMSKTMGLYNVPYELVEMLSIYKKFEKYTDGKMNPFIGNIMENLGYDSKYTLIKKEKVSLPKKLSEMIEIVDEQNVKMLETGLLDLGALGKGFWVDKVKEILRAEKVSEFLVDGSGDIFFQSKKNSITVGLESPFVESEVLGTVNIQNKSICGSAVNRRTWESSGEVLNHVVDAQTGKSAKDIVATWAVADTATMADAVATALFFVDPEKLRREIKNTQSEDFEYLIVYRDKAYLKSENFSGELF